MDCEFLCMDCMVFCVNMMNLVKVSSKDPSRGGGGRGSYDHSGDGKLLGAYEQGEERSAYEISCEG